MGYARMLKYYGISTEIFLCCHVLGGLGFRCVPAAMLKRLSSKLLPVTRRSSCTNPSFQFRRGSFCTAAEVSPTPPSTPEALESSAKKGSPFWTGLRVLFGLTAVSAVAGTSYITYAYTVDDVESKISRYRHAQPTDDQGSQELSFLSSLATEAAMKVVDFYLDLRRSIEDQVKGFAAPTSDKLLPTLAPQEQHVYTLVLDLDETLVYSDWKRDRGWGTFKRPGVDAFLEKMAHFYEIVVYSDQMSFYVDPILERLDQKGCIRYRLARDATQYINGKHLRDVSKLNRDPAKVMYISGHALESCLQPENAVPIKPWKLESDDTALLDLIPFLELVARQRPPDVRTVLASYHGLDIATEFRERAKQNQKRMQERKQHSWLRRNADSNQDVKQNPA